MRRPLAALFLLGMCPAAHAQTQDHAPSALPSADELKQDKPKSESWNYVRPGANLARYKSILIEPTTVYAGPDAQFDKISAEDRQKFATFITEALRREIAGSFPLATKAANGVLGLRVTLVGMEPTQGGLATATRVTPFGLVTSSVKSIAGKKGSLSGSMLLAIELTDGGTGELEAAAVRRRAPDALDIKSTLSTGDTARAIARDLAKHIRQRLDAAVHGREDD